MAETRSIVEHPRARGLPPPPHLGDPSMMEASLLPANPHIQMLNSHLADLYTEIRNQQTELERTSSNIISLMTEAQETVDELVEARTRMALAVDDENEAGEKTSEGEADDEDSGPILHNRYSPRPGTVVHTQYHSRVEGRLLEVEEVSLERRQERSRDTSLAQTLEWYAWNGVGSDGTDQYGRLWMDYQSDADADAERDDHTRSSGDSSDSQYCEDDDSSWRDWFYWRGPNRA